MAEIPPHIREAFAATPLPPERLRAKSEALWHSTPSRRHAHRRVTVAIAASVVIAAIVVPVLVTGGNGTGELGLIVNASAGAATTDAQAHLLDGAIDFGFVPQGFVLASDNRTNTAGAYPSSSRSLTFISTTGGQHAAISISIGQDWTVGSKLRDLADPTLYSLTTTTIRGRSVDVMSYKPPKRSKSAGFLQPCGPPRPSPAKTAAPSAQLEWIEAPGMEVTIQGAGVGTATLERLARGLTLNQSELSCVVGRRVVTTAARCSPGSVTSPPENTPSVPAGGKEVASGTIDGRPWVLASRLATGNSWLSFEYRGEQIGGECAGGGAALAIVPVVSINATLDGHRLASGVVPRFVTSIRATSVHGTSVTVPVLASHLGGVSYFVLSLGTTTGHCADLCKGPITFRLYRGDRAVAIETVGSKYSQFGTFTGFPVSGYTRSDGQ